MKKFISILLSLAVCLSLAACGSGDSAAPDVTDKDAKLTYPYNIVNQPMAVGSVYEYESVCYQEPDLTTNGYVYVYDYTVQPADTDGYVDKTVKARYVFNDDNAWNYGMQFDLLYSDMKGDGIINNNETWSVTHNGQEYDVEILKDEFYNRGWTPGGTFVSDYELTVRVPEGYDDIALFFYNSQYKLNIRDDEGVIPDGTHMTDILDSHCQWFILGGEDGTYYGNPVETQPSRLTPADVLDADINPDTGIYEGDAPPPVPENNEDEIIVDEGFTYVEFDDWSHPSFQREMVYETEIQFTCYNTTPGSYVKAKFWIDDAENPVNETTVENAYSDGMQMHSASVMFVVDGTDTTADSAAFELALYDADGNCVSVTQMDIPFEAEEVADDKQEDTSENLPEDENTPWLDVRPAEEYTLNSLSEYSCVNFFYEIHNLTDGLIISYKAYSIDNPEKIHNEFEFEVTGDGSISVDVWGEKLAGEYVVFEFRLLDADRNVLTEKQFDIKVII